MNLFWRFLRVILFSRFAAATTLLGECRTPFRVLPTDIDLLMHMNNGRYLSLGDIARTDFMIRNKSFPELRRNQVYPVIASEIIRFKKSLPLFQRFDLTTQLLGWDEKYFYIAHTFVANNQSYAQALVKARFLHRKGGKVSPQEILQFIGFTAPSPQLPDWIQSWQQAEQAFSA